MNLLDDIQGSVINGETDISTLLRKCKVLSFKLANTKFKAWVDCELTGYDSIESLPDYRIMSVESYGYFVGQFGEYNNAPIPPASLPEKFRDFATTSYLIRSIAAYASLIRSDGGNPQEMWPADALIRYGQGIYRGMHCISAWKLIPNNALVALVDTIKNRILNFVLEIGSECYDIDTVPRGRQPIPQETVTQIFNTYIWGTVQSVATESYVENQHNAINIVQNDFESLGNYLKSQGVSHEDLSKLGEAIRKDGQESAKLGPKVQKWKEKMLERASTSAWGVSTSVAGSILSKALSSYFGL